MSTLRRQEPAGVGLRRIACDQVETAIRCLTRQAGQSQAAADAIDQARAILALLEADLPSPVVRRDRTIIDRLSKGLLPLHETALLATQLETQYKKTTADPALAAAIKTLRKRWGGSGKSNSAMNNKAGSFNPAIYRLVADMAELRGHLGAWPIDNVPNDTPPRGLRRSYTLARKLGTEPITASTLAPLVKALNELAIQLSITSKACPSMIKAQRKLLTRTGEELNNLIIHDSLDAALRAQLGKSDAKVLPPKKPVAQRAKTCLGSDLADALAETPAAFMKRMQAYWSSWRDSGS